MTPFSLVTSADQVLWPLDYGVHPNHCVDVLAGSYDIPWSPEKPPAILDVGGNIGAFAKWASCRWPGCTIYAYEPQPHNFSLLKRTVESIPDHSKISCFELAVSDKSDTMKLKFHSGAMNCGEWSLNTCGDFKDSVDVTVIPATDLPRADILKIDTEGAEMNILSSLTPRVKEFSAIMMEIHNSGWVKPISDFLTSQGFAIISQEQKFNSEHRVEMKFLKSELLPQGDFSKFLIK